MSSLGSRAGTTNYWLMSDDGSDKIQLTFFDSSDCPEYMGEKVVAADHSWSPRGDRFARLAI